MPIDLEEIKARCGAATPGSWYYELDTYEFTEIPVAYITRPGDKRYIAFIWGDPTISQPSENDLKKYKEQVIRNAEFVSHAREDIPALIAEIEKLRKALAEMWHDLSPFKLFKALRDE